MDLDPRIGLERAAARGALDRIEKEQIAFFDRTREVYLSLAKRDDSVVTIDASQPLPEVQSQIKVALTTWLQQDA